jgi:hypothetical protein
VNDVPSSRHPGRLLKLSEWRTLRRQLVSCPAEEFRKSFDFAEDGVGAGRPGEGPGSGVVGRHEAVGLRDEVRDGAEGGPADGLLGDQANQRST